MYMYIHLDLLTHPPPMYHPIMLPTIIDLTGASSAAPADPEIAQAKALLEKAIA